MADEGIDHRYAAQFQRGFDPARHPASVAPPAANRDAPVRLPGGPPASAPRVDELPRPIIPPSSNPPVPTSDARERELVEPEEQRPRLLDWALPLAAVLLLLVAAYLFSQASTDTIRYVGGDPRDIAWSEMRNTLPGPLLVGAVLAASAWLALRALSGRAR